MSQYSQLSAPAGRKDYEMKNTYYGPESVQIAEPEYASSVNSALYTKDQQTKTWLRGLRIFERLLNFASSGLSLGMMINVLITFYTTRNDKSGSTAAWPTNPNLIPTFINTGNALATTIMSFIVIVSYCCADPFASANRAMGWAGWVSMVTSLISVVSFAVTSGLVQVLNNKNALWSYVCSAEAAAVQGLFSKLNFDLLCTTQTVSFIADLVGIASYLLTAVDLILTYRRWKTKRRLAQSAQGYTG